MPPPTMASLGQHRLQQLFEDSFDLVFGFCLVRCGSRQIAEDVSSDAFVEASRLFADGRGAEVHEGWLITVARRRLIDHWRRGERHRARLEKLSLTTEPVSVHVIGTDDTRIMNALSTLPDRQRASLVLRYLDEFSVPEVSEALQLSYSATESLLARARRSLASAYARTES